MDYSKVNIAFFDTKPYDRRIFEQLNENFGFNIKYFDFRLNNDTAKLVKGNQIACCFVNDDINENVINTFKELGIKMVALRSAGYNNVDLEAAYQNVYITRVPDYSPFAVAEHAVALMLTLNRKIHKAYNRIRENNFSIDGLMGFDMHDKTIGVIGSGKIGVRLIEILKGFGTKVLVYDKYPQEEKAKEIGFSYVELDELYRKSDIISINCPLNKESKHMINKNSIDKMKDGVMLINTSRGSIVDSKDLIEALKNKKIGSAGLDVYEEETGFFFENYSEQVITDDILARLQSFPNVIITSHQGFFTKEGTYNIAKTTLENIKDFFDEKELPNEVCYKNDESKKNKEQKGRSF
ncbi:MAG: 2-hydroxyacid dehydrogenase [bacterium]